MFDKKRRNIVAYTCHSEKAEALYLPINVPTTGFKTISRIIKMRVCVQARRFVKIFGGVQLNNQNFLTKSREFCLHCLYIVDFVCNVRTSQ